MLKKYSLKFPLLFIGVAFAFILLHTPGTWGLTPPETVQQTSVQINGQKQSTGVIVVYQDWQSRRFEAAQVTVEENLEESEFESAPVEDSIDWDKQLNYVLAYTLKNETGIGLINISPEGQWLAHESRDGTIKLWNLKTGQLERIFTGHPIRVDSLEFSPDGQWLASLGDDYTIKLWNLKTGQLQRTLNDSHNIVEFSPDGQWLASLGDDYTIKLWNLKTGQLQRTLNGHSTQLMSVEFSPDGQWLASTSGDTIKLWNLKTRQLERTLNSEAHTIAFSPDGQWLASGRSSNYTIKLWNLKTWQLEYTLQSVSYGSNIVTFSPDGELLVSYAANSPTEIWNLTTRELECTFPMSHRHISSKISRDGYKVITFEPITYEEWMKVWNVENCQLINQVKLIGYPESLFLGSYSISNNLNILAISDNSLIYIFKLNQ